MNKPPKILITKSSQATAGYALLDSGNSEKLERYGEVILRRPDPQALWLPRYDQNYWQRADATFAKEEYRKNSNKPEWVSRTKYPSSWQILFSDLTLIIRPTAFKHTGLFPEQSANWDWTRSIITSAKAKDTKASIKVLNLFGYTGGASLAAAQAGAEVVHVDSSKTSINWGKQNVEASRLEKCNIRWILDDAQEFVRREVRRGNKYHGIILDPPAFGHGPNKQMWRIEENFIDFVQLCISLLAPNALFFLLNGYAAGYSSIAYGNNLNKIVSERGGEIEMGEMAIEESESEGSNVAARLLPCGIFARWQNQF